MSKAGNYKLSPEMIAAGGAALGVAKDPFMRKKEKFFMIASIVTVLSPIDFIPDVLFPIGFADDILLPLTTAVLLAVRQFAMKKLERANVRITSVKTVAD